MHVIGFRENDVRPRVTEWSRFRGPERVWVYEGFNCVVCNQLKTTCRLEGWCDTVWWGVPHCIPPFFGCGPTNNVDLSFAFGFFVCKCGMSRIRNFVRCEFWPHEPSCCAALCCPPYGITWPTWGTRTNQMKCCK